MVMAANENILVVPRGEILARGLSGRCPNCGHDSLFPDDALRIREACPVCGLVFDPGGGFWLGPWVINFTITAFAVVLPLILLGVRGMIPFSLAAILAVLVGVVLLPWLLYRRSWSWWLTLYFYFLPHKLPANGSEETL